MGFFKEELAIASCAECPANSWTLDDGSTDVVACVCNPCFSKPNLATVPSGPTTRCPVSSAKKFCSECGAESAPAGLWLSAAVGDLAWAAGTGSGPMQM